MSSNYLIVGCGDIGRRVASLYEFNTIHGIVRSQESKILNEKLNIDTFLIDLDDSSQTLPQLRYTNIFYFTPPPSEGTSDPRLQNFLNNICNTTKRIVLISTTGVYGNSHGKWIDETTPTNPRTDRAHRRLSAEQLLISWAKLNNTEFIILRVPGIYAKDRLPLSRIKKRLAVVRTNEAGWTNRIHADDLASACKAAMESEISNQIINITDGNPSSMTDYFNHVADYAGLERPPHISMKEAERTLSDGMVSYLKESRRIKNDKMLNILNITLQYPTLSKGLNKKAR